MLKTSHPRNGFRWTRLPLAAATAFVLTIAATSSVRAHINIDTADTHMSRSPGGLFGIKTAPCGAAGIPRGANVYTYRPGATVNISVTENVPHPGYFRLSFDDDGDDDFAIPSGTSGEFGNCAGDPKCGEGKEDFCSNDTVLLDNLDPHASGGGTYTWSVTFPNIECDNCTLQLIQMMNDLNVHPAPYPGDDIYYHCVDIVLSKDAPEVADTPVENDGIVCERPADPEPADMDMDMDMDMETGPPPDEDMETGVPTDDGMPSDMDMSDGMMIDMGVDTPMNAGPAQMPLDSPPMEGGAQSGQGDTDSQTDDAIAATALNGATAGASGGETLAGPAEMGAAPATTTATDDGDDGGCRVASGPRAGSWAPISVALLLLARRRRHSSWRRRASTDDE